MTEKTNSCLCHSFGPLCKVCKETPCTRCQAKFTVAEAAVLGKQAFQAGLGCAPVNSPDFMVRYATVANGPVGVGLPYLTAFSEAWMKLQREAADAEWAAFLESEK